MRIVVALFLAAHGFVHLLYVGQALQKYEVQPGLAWPAGAWAFGWLPDTAVRWLGAALVAAIGVIFVVGGAALAFKAGWWQMATVAGAGVSIATLLLLWNGRFQALDAQGLVAIGLNAAILLSVLWFQWPKVVA